MIARSVVFLSSNFLVKLLPILLGFVLSRSAGGSAYAGFVSFVLFSGLISNISILGANPQIISIKGSDNYRNAEYVKITFLGFLLLVICAACVLAAFVLDLVSVYLIAVLGYEGVIAAFLYSMGLYLVYVSAAKLNNELLTKNASLLWLSYSAITVFATIVWFIYAKNNLLLLVYLMAFSSFITGVIGYINSIRGCPVLSTLINVGKGGYLIILKRQLSYSLFGFGIIGVFFYYQNMLSLLSINEGAFFSLFYQLFALIIFVPSTLGNIVVPHFLSKPTSYFPPKIYLYYFFISSVLCVCVLYAWPYLLYIYKIDMQFSSELSLILLSVSILAATNSYSVQVLVAKKNYKVLLISTMCWATVSLILTTLMGLDIQAIALSLLVSYSLVFIGTGFCLYKFGYVR